MDAGLAGRVNDRRTTRRLFDVASVDEPMTHWTEELFVDRADAFRPFLEGREEEAPREVEDLLALIADTYGHEPESALDVACGIGRHLVPLAEAGIEATGVDVSPDYVEAARERAASAGVEDRVTVVEGDMRELDALEGEFDLVTSFWTSVGYFDRAGNRDTFEGMYDRLAPGGVVALELNNKEGVLGDFRTANVTVEDDELDAERREYDPETSRMTVTLHSVDLEAETYEGSIEWDVRLYAPVDLRERLSDAGFEEIALFAGFDGEALARESPRMVVLGRKPE